MGWELRFFSQKPIGLTSPELHAPKDETEYNTRTDVYVTSPSCEHGVKRRGDAPGFEVKILKEKKKRGAEKWKKIREFFPTLSEVADAIRHPGFQDAAQEMKVSKRIHKQYITVEGNDLVLEHTIVDAKGETWYSINIEGAEPKVLYHAAYLLLDVPGKDDEKNWFANLETKGVYPGGYPLFVQRVLGLL